MSDTHTVSSKSANKPQCQFYVMRKKRLCRMTVRPGKHYCGEHEPDPEAGDGLNNARIPCPNDPKHTCYIHKLDKHLQICNARPKELPSYIVPNINAPTATQHCHRKPLAEISKETLAQVIDKINFLFDKHIQDNLLTAEERPIHGTVVEEFSECHRTESSLRHLRQASRLLWLAEDEGLVQDRTCYVELGAGKGHLSYYACAAWCAQQQRGSRALAVDRASLRHKRDNRARAASRLRADLAHLALERAPPVLASRAVVGLAKHLCGVATDFALRCMTAAGVLHKTRGLVLATCCHHRCELAGYVANKHLQELGVSADELNAMLGIVSWATCGDGRSRNANRPLAPPTEHTDQTQDNGQTQRDNCELEINSNVNIEMTEDSSVSTCDTSHNFNGVVLSQQQYRELVGRRAKALLDWGRVLYLREVGFDARLCYYVPTSVSLENLCIVARKC